MSDEKTEQPTSKKLRDAREKGQVANSKDVASTALLVALFAYFFIAWDWIYESCLELIRLPAEFYDVPFAEAYPEIIAASVTKILLLTLPVLGVVMVVGVAANYFQIGALFVLEPMKPDLKKLNPVDKAKQIFSIKNLVEFAKSVFKVAFLGILLFLLIRDSLSALVEVPYSGLDGVLVLLGKLMFLVAIYTSFVYIVIAAIDFGFQRWQHNKQLMMSKDEVKREYKEMEGDPTIKSKRKQLHQEMVMSDNVEKTKKSTVLVTNPTHRAIAIYYEEGETKLPMIMAKGEGALAERMIAAAKEAGIPIMQNVPLAHDLFDHGHIEQYIPTELIEPIAEVLRWVQQIQEEQQS